MKKQTKKTISMRSLLILLIFIVTFAVIMLSVRLLTGTKEEPMPVVPTSENAESSDIEAFSGKKVYADIDIEGYGKIVVLLDADAAPITVGNFVKLANQKFYDGLSFHRIMCDFMMQGGDPTGTGAGGAEHKIKGEFSANGVNNPISHTRGAISMARSASFDSASSQFFIVHQDSTFLDGQYAGFGYVTEGIEIVDEICNNASPIDDNGTIAPDMQPVISSISIRIEDNSTAN